MQDQRIASSGRVRNVWLEVAATVEVIGVLWGGMALHEAAGRNASVAQGASGAGGVPTEIGETQALTTDTTPHAAAAIRPPIDLTPVPAVETATFALG